MLGVLIFALAQWYDHRTSHYRIIVSPERIAAMMAAHRQQFGTDPDARTRRALIDRYIESEMLLREARARNLDRDDEIVRRRMVQKMQFLLDDIDTPREPTDDELRAFHRQHAASYREPGKISFSHIYFVDRQRAEATLATLPDTVERAPERSDLFAGAFDLARIDGERAVRLFGSSELTAKLFAAPPHRWVGPWRSAYGWHLVRISLVEPATSPAFDVLRSRLREDWRAEQQATAHRDRLSSLMEKYTIERPE